MNDNEDPKPPDSTETRNEAPPSKTEDYLVDELQSRIESDAKLIRDDIDKSGVGWGQAHSTKSLLGDIVLASWKLGQIAAQARANMRTLSQKLIDEHGQVQALIVERNCLKLANEELKTANTEWRERAEQLEGMFNRASKEANDRRMYPMKYARDQHEAAVAEFRKAFEAERDSLVECLAAERRACAEMKEKLDSAERKVLGLTVSLGEANRTCADMRRGLDLRKERIIALNEELRLERSRVMSFRKEHDILIEERVKLIDERESLQSKLEKQLSDVQEHLVQTSKEYDRVSASLRQAELNLGAYRSRCEAMNGLQAKVEELQSALEEAKAESRSRYESKMDAVFAATKLQSKLHEANLREGLTSDELAKKIEENKKLIAEVKELKSAIAYMDSAMEKLKAEKKAILSALDTTQLSLKRAEADLAVALLREASGSNARRQQENDQYWRDIYNQCDSEREKLKRELGECQALAEKLAEEVESLTSIVEQHAKEHEEGDA